MISIGLTGGYASGKSTVAGMLRSLGAHVVDADALAHAVLALESAKREVVDAFGPGILSPHGEIDRAALGRLVFDHPDLRRRLERIVHPRVIHMMEAEREAARQAGAAVFVCEAPLLYEAGLAERFDQVWVVSSKTENQTARAVSRDKLSLDEAQKRLAAQMPLAEKESRADLVLHNDGGLADLRLQVEAAWRGLVKRKGL
ncbi:MAG: dephospho-CoA kinase [Patescibacteria group bacterium]